VDALTYGLSTLCMGDVVPHHTSSQNYNCSHCGGQNAVNFEPSLTAISRNGQTRLGNQYPQFTRKFSLGNGPSDWVQEYLITKESGKMLGTLVALAVARMINLETFVWDMPTGVLRDVWLALSSLQTRSVDQDCRLERVWVRWHDNSDQAHLPASQTSDPTPSSPPAGSTMTSIGWSIQASTVPPQANARPLAYSQSRVEYPTLSVLPPLKSLSVLDIDELDYLDEMSVLIAKSKDSLRELRVGISNKAVSRDFAFAWDGPDLHQVDHKAKWPGASTIGKKRLGGVLGVLVGRVFDIRRKQKAKIEKKESLVPMASATVVSSPTPQVHFNGSTSASEGFIAEEEAAENESLEGSSHGKETPTSSGSVASAVAFNIEGGTPSDVPGTPAVNQISASISPTESTQADIESIAALVLGTNDLYGRQLTGPSCRAISAGCRTSVETITFSGSETLAFLWKRILRA
jgi:hypothetical protein